MRDGGFCALDRLLGGLEIDPCVGGSELAPGERTAGELIKLAPYRERGHALLMEILSARGNSAEALRIYEQLRGRLREELGATPAPELRQLQQRLLQR